MHPAQCQGCLDCAAGKYLETLGNNDEGDCLVCPRDTFSSLLGASNRSDCLNCDVRASSDAGSDSQEDCICNAGYVGIDVCSVCPKNYWCPGGDVQIPCPNHSSSIQGSSDLNECKCNPGWWPRESRYGGPEFCSPRCSDGIRVQGEGCDDGNQLENDGCSSMCQIQLGWYCNRATPLDSDRCSTTCGKITNV
jgi:cysteine-rich repeat protein